MRALAALVIIAGLGILLGLLITGAITLALALATRIWG